MNKEIKTIRRRSAVLGLLSLCLAAGARASEPDVQQLLANADRARGGGLVGLVWEVHAHNSGNGADEQQDQRLRVKATNDASLAEVLEPASSKGARILQSGRNMWISKPGLKKPVAISPRQRLTGQAAIGDIAATHYARDYTGKYLREELVGDEPCYVLDLSAVNRQSTYDRITYWVSVRRGVALQAEFLSLSGKKLKSAQFDYANKGMVNGKPIAFISRMTIADALTDATTVMEFANIKAQPVAASDFDVDNLQ